MMTPDGMGADRYNERQNMIASNHEEPTASHDVWAVDRDGELLYVAESAWTYEAAESERDACEKLLASTAPHNIPEEVAGFEIRAR